MKDAKWWIDTWPSLSGGLDIIKTGSIGGGSSNIIPGFDG